MRWLEPQIHRGFDFVRDCLYGRGRSNSNSSVTTSTKTDDSPRDLLQPEGHGSSGDRGHDHELPHQKGLRRPRDLPDPEPSRTTRIKRFSTTRTSSTFEGHKRSSNFQVGSHFYFDVSIWKSSRAHQFIDVYQHRRGSIGTWWNSDTISTVGDATWERISY